MKDNVITLTVKNNQVEVKYKLPMTIQDYLQIISTSILAAMNGVVNSAPEAERPAIKEDLYDMYNAAASTTLNYFAPEIEMRPHLTAQAILEAENKIIKEGRAPKLSKNVVPMRKRVE